MKMSMEQWWNDTDMRRPMYCGGGGHYAPVPVVWPNMDCPGIEIALSR